MFVAFSLVELSIVLVILGLLVGGVLGGQALIRAAELRSVVRQYHEFTVAHNSFKGKYAAVAGDMDNATQFWGAADGSHPLDCITALCSPLITPTATCNGTGDGFVNQGSSAGGCWMRESSSYWHHMSNAGLIPGKFNQGVSSNSYYSSNELPSGKISNSLWFPYSYGEAPDASDQRFSFRLRGFRESGSFNYNVFAGKDLWSIDIKIDDGKPRVGKIMGEGFADCITGFTESDTYVLDKSTRTCSGLFYTE
jgi:hypothetical protein